MSRGLSLKSRIAFSRLVFSRFPSEERGRVSPSAVSMGRERKNLYRGHIRAEEMDGGKGGQVPPSD